MEVLESTHTIDDPFLSHSRTQIDQYIMLNGREIWLDDGFGHDWKESKFSRLLNYVAANEPELKRKFVDLLNQDEDCGRCLPNGRLITPRLLGNSANYEAKVQLVGINSDGIFASKDSQDLDFELLYESDELYGEWLLSAYFDSAGQCIDFGSDRDKGTP